MCLQNQETYLGSFLYKGENMGMGIYTGVGNVARQVKQPYIGVGGITFCR